MPAQLELYSKFGYPVQLRYMGEPVVYAAAESGELNTFHHIWVYESAADREAKRAQMAKDPDWKVYLGENGKAGHIVEQRDGWSLRTTDGSMAAQFEHTIVVTRGEPIILTR
jgi:hypothetical protein